MNRIISIAGLSVTFGFSALASANPTEFEITSDTIDAAGDMQEVDSIDYTFGMFDSLFDEQSFSIFVSGGPSTRPEFDYELNVNYSDYNIGEFGEAGTHSLSLTGIKDPDSEFPITDVFVKDAQGNAVGNWEFVAGSIFFDASVGDILQGGEEITVQWSQVPTPGALALFSMSGLAMMRRRR